MNISPLIMNLPAYNKKAGLQALAKYVTVLSCLCCFFPAAGQTIRSATGLNAAAIQPVVNQYRLDLGTLNPNQAVSFGSGRREINWDGVADASAAPNNLPANFFNVNSPRGVIFTTPGTGFQVSANIGNPTGNPVEFGNINPTYPSLFAPFSPQRLFTSLGSNITDVNFFIPGTTTPAVVRGFGGIFSDVDLSTSTSIQFFDPNNISLGTFMVSGMIGNETFSFLGVFYPTPIVSRVRIISGNAILASTTNENGSVVDLVVMDDFIYGEPNSLAVPCSLTCPANITVSNTTGQCGAVVNYPAPTITETCGTVTASPASGSFFPVGTTTVNVSSTSGASCLFTIRVDDVQVPTILSCPTVNPFCGNATGIYTIPELTATDNCPGVNVSYGITGATIRTGSGNNASGSFNPGVSTITWRAQDASGNFVNCQTTVTVGVNPTVNIPDAFALASGVAANTVYLGYAPASSIILTAQANGTPPYTYTWSNGSHASTILVNPTTTTTYTVTVQDGTGCSGTAFKTINVVDVRCGNKGNKVQVCQVSPGNLSNAHGICISSNAVAAHIANGSYLGTCTNSAITTTINKGGGQKKQNIMGEHLVVDVINNPAQTKFTLIAKSNTTQTLEVKIYNALGVFVEGRTNVAVGAALQFGQGYQPGMYYAEISQGKQKVILKLVKGNQ